MARDLARQGKFLAKKGTVFQLVTAAGLTASAWAFGTAQLSLSVAVGAVISILPNFVFALFAFRYAGASKNSLVARSFSQGSRVKLALTILLFVVAFVVLDTRPLALFGAFAITTVSYWLALVRHFPTGSDER
ncbi:ATPase F0F1 [Alteromonas aestuariivivens]|uniref:ATPase F0F1 n=1 Tax=Alteromonas aestuariivivens TaxID=1938339 RepID=A0A3D8M554_9ALTE|nr:ATP synthase subunit I [Alteromonas aestuariivivens]RDV24796.1 ATPase F0F1 [Alteromonas aestuariivivens]